jgi:hypothetical protein
MSMPLLLFLSSHSIIKSLNILPASPDHTPGEFGGVLNVGFRVAEGVGEEGNSPRFVKASKITVGSRRPMAVV